MTLFRSQSFIFSMELLRGLVLSFLASFLLTMLLSRDVFRSRYSIVISFLLGIILFFLPVELPEVLNSAVVAISSMNAPVAMIILATYLAQMKL